MVESSFDLEQQKLCADLDMYDYIRRNLAIDVTKFPKWIPWSEGPILEGNGWPARMSMVMHNGHIDMRRWQEEIDEVDRRDEAQELELETPPEDNDVKLKTPDPEVARRKRFVMDKKRLRWSQAIIPYVFDDSVGMAPNFEKITKKSGVRHFGYYDMSSVMGYSTWAFSKNTKDTITVLDPETQYLAIQKDVTAYYMFYEAQQLYDMRAEKCPEFHGTCRNRGYLSYVNGSCRCRCPEGLDYKSNCAEIEEGLSGGVIYLTDSKDRANITSLGYPDTPANASTCVWFVKGPAGSRIVLDFDSFNIPYRKSCTTYVEIRFVMPGQPGIRYCGDSFSETVVSYGEYIAITHAGNSDENQGKFAASVRLIKDEDLCYTDGGKDGSYQGKCYDIFDDCGKQLQKNPLYCHNDPEAKRGCRLSCDFCSDVTKVPSVSNVTCSAPAKMVPDGTLISDKLTYKVGEEAVYRCNSSNSSGERSVTCTSNGTWTYIGFVCDDNPGCADQRLDCDTLLERTPTMCTEHSYFAGIKCAKTCGLCTKHQKVECDVALVTGNVTETSTGPYYVGSVVRYKCIENFVHSAGHLDRACRNNQTLTGETPSCSALEDTVSSTHHVDLRRRRSTSPADKIYTFSNSFYRIKRKGEIIAWQFYSLFSGKVTFQVWRQAGDTDSYKLLGSNEIEDTLEDRLVTMNVSIDQRISVQPGDFIGLYLSATNPGGIVYDTCKVKYDPEGGNQLVPTGSAPWRVGQYYKMKQTSSCKLFSISAKIGPKRTANIQSLKRAWSRFLQFHR
ncbi:uncharacterized protein LOC123523059 [Mercenaria mercenaria]|uniref:uncharacterized protein LOC123523059 n=1 Tax=Mercenaria mercenaria TaxID=6596 RepID=UPI00234EC8ED|nr:uncharacterized protein LOC123523059 [Mercenaria mercenaria]